MKFQSPLYHERRVISPTQDLDKAEDGTRGACTSTSERRMAGESEASLKSKPRGRVRSLAPSVSACTYPYCSVPLLQEVCTTVASDNVVRFAF